MDINFAALGYLFLRLAPFIIVSFFALSSLFNQDFKGIIYLVGLLVSTVLVVSIETILPAFIIEAPSEKDYTCDSLRISTNSPISNLPLGTGVIAYTLGYLLFIIVKYNYVKDNAPTLIFFSALLILEVLWHSQHYCFTLISILITILLFAGLGTLISFLIDHLKMTDLQYFNGVSGKEACSRPQKQTFRCNVYKNGQLITTT
jgi:hypothetical protein|tara:strand:- start:935 stop:1543 length:609 start_codon:yes stop_codon:yes gene_type:complete